MSKNYIPHTEQFANLWESRTLISNQEDVCARVLFGAAADVSKIYRVEGGCYMSNDTAYCWLDEHDPERVFWATDDSGNVWHKEFAVNRSGTIVEFAAAVSYMDDDIRDDLHGDLAPCGIQAFFEAYEAAHEEKHGEPWFLSAKVLNW